MFAFLIGGLVCRNHHQLKARPGPHRPARRGAGPSEFVRFSDLSCGSHKALGLCFKGPWERWFIQDVWAKLTTIFASFCKGFPHRFCSVYAKVNNRLGVGRNQGAPFPTEQTWVCCRIRLWILGADSTDRDVRCPLDR